MNFDALHHNKSISKNVEAKLLVKYYLMKINNIKLSSEKKTCTTEATISEIINYTIFLYNFYILLYCLLDKIFKLSISKICIYDTKLSALLLNLRL